MTTTKQRLYDIKEKIRMETNSYQAGELLAPLLLEMVEALKKYKGFGYAGTYPADDALNKFEEFLK